MMAKDDDKSNEPDDDALTEEFFNEGLSDEEIEAARAEALEADGAEKAKEAGEADAAAEAKKAESEAETEALEKAGEAEEADKEAEQAAAASKASGRDADLAEFRTKNKDKSRDELEELAFNQSKRAGAEKHKGREKSAEAAAAAQAATERASEAEEKYSSLVTTITDRRNKAVKEAEDKAVERKENLAEDPDKVTQNIIDEQRDRSIREADAEAASARRQADDAKLLELIPDFPRKANAIGMTLEKIYEVASEDIDRWSHKEWQMAHDAHIGVMLMSQGYVDSLGNPNWEAIGKAVDNYRAEKTGANGEDAEQDPPPLTAEEKAAENQRKIEAAQKAQDADKSLSNMRGGGPGEPKKLLHEQVNAAVDEMDEDEWAAFLASKDGQKALREQQS